MAPIQFGFLMVPYQALDSVGPLDVLHACSRPYLHILEQMGGPPGIADRGIDIEFHHINETMSPVTLTGRMSINPTTTCDDCPPLDYLLIGGPATFDLSPRFVEFIHEHVKRGKVLFTTCTGGIVAAAAGVLDGKNATTNHGAVPTAKHLFPKVKWTQEKQWVVDGQFWTSGGACAGMDMMANWVMENYDMDVAKGGFMVLDYEPRDVTKKMVFPQQRGVANGEK